MESCEFEVLNEVYLQNFLHRWAVNREPNLMSTLGLFAWCPGKAAWPRQQAQASDFGGLGSGSLPGRAASKQALIHSVVTG